MESDFGSGGIQSASATDSGSRGGLLSKGLVGGLFSGGSSPGGVPDASGGGGALNDLLSSLQAPLGLNQQAGSRFQRLQQFALGRGGALQPMDSGEGSKIADIMKLLGGGGG